MRKIDLETRGAEIPGAGREMRFWKRKGAASAPREPIPGSQVVRWSDPFTDPALAAIVASATARARRHLPDVRTTPAEAPPEFDELIALSAQRLRGLQADALGAAGPHVERVLAHNDYSDPSAALDDRALSQASRAVAAEHRVKTLTDALRVAIDDHVAYAKQALAILDGTIRRHHRHSAWLEYEIPTLEVPKDIYEIGLARIREARRRSEDAEHVA